MEDRYLICSRKLTDPYGRVVHKPSQLLDIGRKVCELFFGTYDSSGEEVLDPILKRPNGTQYALTIIEQNYFRQLSDEPPSYEEYGYDEVGDFVEGGASALLFSLCPDHARQVARAYLRIHFYFKNCLQARPNDLPDEKSFYAVGTVVNPAEWVSVVIAVLLRGRVLGLFSAKKFNRAIVGLRGISKQDPGKFDRRIEELRVALENDDRDEMFRVEEKLAKHAGRDWRAKDRFAGRWYDSWDWIQI
jgi:hypothetical protein